MKRFYFWQTFLLTTILVGCKIGPQYKSPEITIPNEWHHPPSNGMCHESLDCFIWWESLNDPVLNCLIKQAAVQNLDLYIAGTRILEARMERKGKMAELYPHLNGSAALGHVYYSKDALVNGVLGPCCSASSRDSHKRNENFFEIGFDAEWEIDLFGAKQHEIKASTAKLEAAEENLCDIWVTLSAEIARNYIEMRGLQQRLTLLHKNIETQKEIVALIQELLRVGLASTLEVQETEEQLHELIAQKPLIELAIHKTIHHLSTLLGYAPGELYAELINPKQLPCLPYEKPIGLPSELLRRRPDIRKAEREFVVATAYVGSAMAALFPRLTLRGFIGDISNHLSSLLSSSSHTWFAGPQLLQPIFNSKLLRQDIDFSKIKVRQALYFYQKTVLTALEEVENGIASFHFELERNVYLKQARLSAHQAYEASLDLYQQGFKDYQEVLINYRSFLQVENSYLQSHIDLLIHYISLYKALGGGWDITDCNSEEDEPSQMDGCQDDPQESCC